jgi:hypothetical protein
MVSGGNVLAPGLRKPPRPWLSPGIPKVKVGRFRLFIDTKEALAYIIILDGLEF